VVERVEADIRADLQAHIDHGAAEAIEAGASPDQALRSAEESLGDVESIVRACARVGRQDARAGGDGQ